jgi:hypothetical protein
VLRVLGEHEAVDRRLERVVPVLGVDLREREEVEVLERLPSNCWPANVPSRYIAESLLSDRAASCQVRGGRSRLSSRLSPLVLWLGSSPTY